MKFEPLPRTLLWKLKFDMVTRGYILILPFSYPSKPKLAEFFIIGSPELNLYLLPLLLGFGITEPQKKCSNSKRWQCQNFGNLFFFRWPFFCWKGVPVLLQILLSDLKLIFKLPQHLYPFSFWDFETQNRHPFSRLSPTSTGRFHMRLICEDIMNKKYSPLVGLYNPDAPCMEYYYPRNLQQDPLNGHLNLSI